MFQITVSTLRGTRVADVLISEPTCVIGTSAANAVVLRDWRIESRHARLNQDKQGIFVHDLQSRIGTRVNGRPIRTYGPLLADDEIQIHDYRLHVVPRVARPMNASSVPGGQDRSDASISSKDVRYAEPTGRAPRPRADDIAAPTADSSSMHSWRVRLRQTLHEQIDLRRINVSAMTDAELRETTSRLVTEILDASKEFPAALDRAALTLQVVAEAVGLGPLEPLLARDDVSEIMVNGAREIFFECDGRLQHSDVAFTDDKAVQSTIERIVAPLGRRIDEGSPMVDARLKDGSRVNAIIPPLALKGPCLTIRKFMKERLTADRLVGFGSISDAMVAFLDLAVLYKRNILISGGTGSGKTTLLNVLSNFIPEQERIVTIEDAAELRLYQPNLVSLEARPANQEGRGAVTIRDLVRNSLRMRPDRIVVGECRGAEALDMLQAMNTGHDGSLTTAHANNPRDCISRLEVMVMMAGMDLPIIAIREQIASAIHLIVQQTRFSCGARKVTNISEITGMENGRLQLGEIFRFVQTGYDADHRVQGHFVATGLIPEFYEDLRKRGARLDLSIFQASV
jgi:pilus assembly protein CpaF